MYLLSYSRNVLPEVIPDLLTQSSHQPLLGSVVTQMDLVQILDSCFLKNRYIYDPVHLCLPFLFFCVCDNCPCLFPLLILFTSELKLNITRFLAIVRLVFCKILHFLATYTLNWMCVLTDCISDIVICVRFTFC